MDTGSHYFSPGTDKIVDEFSTLCSSCSRKSCHEPNSPCISMNTEDTTWDIFYPFSYELADLRHAIKGFAGMIAFPVLLGPHHSPQVLDMHLGPGCWARILDDSDMLPAITKIKNSNILF